MKAKIYDVVTNGKVCRLMGQNGHFYEERRVTGAGSFGPFEPVEFTSIEEAEEKAKEITWTFC